MSCQKFQESTVPSESVDQKTLAVYRLGRPARAACETDVSSRGSHHGLILLVPLGLRILLLERVTR